MCREAVFEEWYKQLMMDIDVLVKKKKQADLDLDLEWPKCLNEWCTSNLPATRYIPIRPDEPTIKYRVCENCYYDYEYEGIYTYSFTDKQLKYRNMTEEERFKLWSKLDKLNWDPHWRDKERRGLE